MNRTDGAYIIAVFTDISKAFDSVPLDELVDVIWSSAIPTAYKWVISSFVEGRQFRVEIRDANGNISASKWRKMLFGTPQGSILGPMLWNLFFDPLLEKLQRLKEETNRLTEDINISPASLTTLDSLNPLLQRLEELKEETKYLLQTSKNVADAIKPGDGNLNKEQKHTCEPGSVNLRMKYTGDASKSGDILMVN